jgi:hypothetical protein
MQSDHRPGGRRFAGIVLTELDRDTLATVGDTHLLLEHERLIEGPKLLWRTAGTTSSSRRAVRDSSTESWWHAAVP